MEDPYGEQDNMNTMTDDKNNGICQPTPREAGGSGGGGGKKKAGYAPLPPGTTVLVDVANLIGALGPEGAAAKLEMVRESLKRMGYPTILFWEQRGYFWCLCHQGEGSAESDKAALKRLIRGGGVSMVDGEADLAMLQVCRAIPGSVCVSRDRFDDYKGVFGDIVGNGRVRAFSWAEAVGTIFLSIEGLAEAIVIRVAKGGEEGAPQGGGEPASAAETEETAEEIGAAGEMIGAAGLVAQGRALLEKGEAEKGLRCFGRLVRKGDPEGYRAMADAYGEGRGVEPDEKKAVRYAKLARRQEKRRREEAMRRKRGASRHHGWRAGGAAYRRAG